MSAAGSTDSGVTLLEALVVIAITALIAAIVAPNMAASLDLLSLRQSAAVLQADLRVAHATALRTGSPVTVKGLPDRHGYDWIGGTRHFPTAVSVNMSAPVSFLPDGSLIPATISIASGARRVPISIDSTTGAIKAGGR
jgi:prepilin-type N-terminal cleavage/methylation domain-containing protein